MILRGTEYERRVIDRVLLAGIEMETDGVEESTRSAVRRRQSLGLDR